MASPVAGRRRPARRGLPIKSRRLAKDRRRRGVGQGVAQSSQYA